MSRLTKLKERKEELEDELKQTEDNWRTDQIEKHLEQVRWEIKNYGQDEPGPELLRQRF